MPLPFQFDSEAGIISRTPNVRRAIPTSSLISRSTLTRLLPGGEDEDEGVTLPPLSHCWFWIKEGSSHQAAALSYALLVLPISQSVHAHRTKSTELLNFDVVRSGGL